MDIGDLFPEGGAGFFGTYTPTKLLRLFYQLSHRFDSHERRFNIFKRAMEKTTRSLYTIAHEVSIQDQQHGKYGSKRTREPEEKLTVNSEQLEELEKLACNKIESWADDGRLAKHKYLPSILFRWKDWEKRDKINNFVNNMIKNDDGLIEFITSFLSKSTSQGISDYVERIHWRISLENVEEFMDLKEIEPRIRKIFSFSDFKHLDDRKKLAMKTFLDTIDGKIKDRF
jgi:predicted KAP-like P-loop ATPase